MEISQNQFNQIYGVLETLDMCARGAQYEDVSQVIISSRLLGQVRQVFDEIKDFDQYKSEPPPSSWDAFLSRQAQIHEEKNHDYENRFIKSLITYGAIIWTWEVTKKLDRLRTWLSKGELQVKGEGINNAVGDMFNYTVQHEIYNKHYLRAIDHLSVYDFNKMAKSRSPEQWVLFWQMCGLITAKEAELKRLILTYLGVPTPDSNQQPPNA